MEVVVVGGGASGMIAAIVAAQNKHKVTLLEQKDRLGKKILATGNGRCNLGNKSLLESPWEKYPLCDEKMIKNIFDRFGYEETMSMFGSMGIITKSRNDLLYPYSDQASAVLDCLRFRIRDLKIKVICDCKVIRINKQGKLFKLETNLKEYTADKVILSTGSKAQPKLGSDGSGYEIAKLLGHKIDKVTPGLVQIKAEGNFYKAASGVRIAATLKLMDDSKLIHLEAGEVQFTDYGISGIVAMNISNRLHLCHGKCYILADFMSEYSYEMLLSELMDRKQRHKNSDASELLIGIMPKKLSEVILKLSGISLSDMPEKLDNTKIKNVVNNIKAFRVDVTGTKSFDDAQICLGGVNTNEIKDTMESKLVSGLYFCGEILNLHGDCGGYNLQLCWSTGAIAGMLQ